MNQLAAAICVFGALSLATAELATAEDLSKYRDFQLGGDLATVSKLAGMIPSEAKLLHSRPAVMQQLTWRPQSLGASLHTEPAKDVVFSFYNGELYQISVSYDRRETEGLTAGDMVDAISGTYGVSTRPAPLSKPSLPIFGEQEEVIAQWQDAQYRFNLIRASYGPEFKLVGVLKRLEEPAQSAALEASRLDDKEAPQREAARLSEESDAERVRLEKARLVNKKKFRP